MNNNICIKSNRPTRLLQFVTYVYLTFSIRFGLLTYFASSVFLMDKKLYSLRCRLRKGREEENSGASAKRDRREGHSILECEYVICDR